MSTSLLKAPKTGDTVTWNSAAGGYNSKKTGKVLAVVPAGEAPEASFLKAVGAKNLDELKECWRVRSLASTPSKSERYIIETEGETPKSKPYLYCPVEVPTVI